MTLREFSTIKGCTIRVKVILAVALVFMLTLIASTLYSEHSKKGWVLELVERQAESLTDAYFDGLNILMLTGAMATRTTLRDKFLARAEVLEARVVRGKPVTKQFGPGMPEEAPEDELDRQALQGKEAIVVGREDGKRVLTVVRPLVAAKNMRGVNCMQCHDATPGAVLGAVRLKLSLAEWDAAVDRDQWLVIAVNLSLFAAGLLVMGWLLHRVVTRPLDELRSTMESIEAESDLGRRIALNSHDEIGKTAHAFNKMLDKFKGIIEQVSGSTAHLASLAEQLVVVTDQTDRGIDQQRSDTEQLATAMNEMAATVQEVARNTAQAAQAAHGADQEAKGGAVLATEATGAIEVLAKQLEEATGVIRKLEDESRNIGAVLDIIRNIAEQTNLLALNAAIEAARAGEQGRGFAVVADEVRTLAQRTQQSTQEIHQMIERLQAEAGEAVQAMTDAGAQAQTSVERVEKTAESLASIAAAVTVITDMNTQIASAAEEQSAVAEEVNRNVVNISQVAEQTADGAHRTKAASGQLARLAEELKGLVAMFKR